MMLDSGCLSASVADVAEPEKQSSPDDQKQTPTAPHGCHGHHSGVPAETLVAASEVPFAQSHARMMAAARPPVAYIGTFRPPIARRIRSAQDRKSVVEGKSVSVRVDLGGGG